MRKGVFLILVLLNSSQVFAQYLTQYMELISTHSSLSEVTVTASMYNIEDTIPPIFKPKSKVTIDREKKVANFEFGAVGISGQEFYDNNWRVVKFLETQSDSTILVWTCKYDSKSRVISTKCFKQENRHTNISFLNIQDTFLYCHKTKEQLKKRTKYLNNGTTQVVFTKTSTQKNIFGQLKQEKIYKSYDNTNQFVLQVKKEVKYSLFGQRKRKEVIHIPQYDLPEIRKYKYRKGVLIEKLVTSHLNTSQTIHYHYKNGLIKRKIHIVENEIEEWRYDYKLN